MAGALADVLLGDADPGGRLPTTQPLRLEHNPSYGNFPGENGEVRYGEGVLMGYRWYDARALPVRFPFGHGLSYATFELGAPRASADDLLARLDPDRRGRRHQHERPRRLRGRPALRRAAAERARPPAARAARVRQGQRSAPARRTTVALELADRAFAYWDPGDPSWESLLPRAAVSPMIRSDEQRRTTGGWRIDPGELRPARRPLVGRPPPRDRGARGVTRGGRTLLIVVAAIGAGGLGLTAWVNSEFTECYALFDSEAQAEATAADLRRAAPDVGFSLDNEHRQDELATTFYTGETGEDAQPLVDAFQRAVRANGGELGHPEPGCLSRGPIN